MFSIPTIAAALAFLLTLWLFYFSPFSGIIRTAVDVLSDPIVSLISSTVAIAVAIYIINTLFA